MGRPQADTRAHALARRLVVSMGLAAAMVFSPSAIAVSSAATVEAETMQLASSAGVVFDDSTAGAGRGLLIWSNASAVKSLPMAGGVLRLRVRGDQCAGAPRMTVKVGAATVLDTAVPQAGWTDYATSAIPSTGTHAVSIAFTNDYLGSGCDRNLRVDRLELDAPASPTPTPTAVPTAVPTPSPTTTPVPAARVEGETFQLPASAGTVFDDSTASGAKGLLIWSNASAVRPLAVSGGVLRVRVRGDQCAGAPQMTVKVGAATVLSTLVTQSVWTDFTSSALPASGTHSVSIAFTNDYLGGGCDRNLRVDRVELNTTATPTPTPTATPTASPTATPTASPTNPIAGARLWVDPDSNPKRTADSWRSSRPADAAAMDKIATRPIGDWFGDWNSDIRSAVSSRVSAAAAAGAVPILVAYNIPQRDCGGYSGGGVSPDAYRTWIRGFAEGIGSRRAVVILEPDALSLTHCLTAANRETRFALIRDAVATLEARAGTSVYIDAGHSGWTDPAEMAGLLNNSGVAGAAGFSLNVSNFNSNGAELAYGKTISARAGGKHFVIDTSRNGLGSNGQWCNPDGRALGTPPTTVTGEPAADAFLWIKRVGESDGTCNGGPSAGGWWPDYALGLARRAAF